MNYYVNYDELVKPTWAPPSWIFGPVWSVLYLLIIVSFGKVFIMLSAQQIPFIVALPFILNILFNIIFTPIQFGLKNLSLAAIDILLVLSTLIWAMVAIHRYSPTITYLQIPYLLWVAFATILQLTVTCMNR